jgi:hypothetical protein
MLGKKNLTTLLLRKKGALIKDVKMRQLLVVVLAIVSVMAMVLTSCGSGNSTTPAATVTVTATKTVTASAPATTAGAKVYKALNPAGVYIPVETKPNAPRLTTFDGKKILIYQSEGSSIIMPATWRKAQATLTKSILSTVIVESFGRGTPDENDLKVEGVIRGVSW